jgi:signal peptidase I
MIQAFLLKQWREWRLFLGVFVLVILPVKSAVVDWNWVPTGSMKPTILEGDLVLVNKLSYDLKVPFTRHRLAHWSDPARGDVVVFFSPEGGTRLVKRVIGLPGDVVEMRAETIYLNGQPLAYSLADLKPFADAIYEDSSALVARESLTKDPHLVLILPSRPALRTFAPVTVPAGHYFMLGDSRDNSHDSRFFGPVARDNIVGCARMTLLSFDLRKWAKPRLERILQPLDKPAASS